MSTSELDEFALQLICIMDNMVAWAELPEDIRINKWRIIAKRVMAASGADLQEFIHNVVRDIAGDKVKMSKELGDKVNKLKSNIKNDLELIRYVKRRTFPLIVSYMVRQGEA